MKTIRGSRRQHSAAIVSTFLTMLVTVSVIAGMTGCAAPAEYNPPEYTPMVIAAGGLHTLGLKADGTVVAAGPGVEVTKWNLPQATPYIEVGVKAGDWIKIEYTITGWPAEEPYPEWLKLEFLSIEGTTANVLVTVHISDGTEQNATMPVDVVAGGEALGLSGFVIPANLTTGDYVYMTGFGYLAIEGQTTGTYAGANRTVVHTSISQSMPLQGEVQLTYDWDKLTGVLVGGSGTYAGLGVTVVMQATETNMW
jgi:hypothetical protein